MIARLLLLILLLCGSAAHAEIKWTVVRTLPHDTDAFTEGLFIADGLLYESTGLVGQSDFRAMRLTDGKIMRRARLERPYFGEGIVPFGKKMISLTWQHNIGFVWQRSSFKKLGSFKYTGEGWGITTDGKTLIMSDGTTQLRFLDPLKYNQTSTVTVSWQGQPVKSLNELEWVDGAVYANIWYQPLIARIDPRTGVITDFLNLSPLVAQSAGNGDNVLNGIAWDAKAKLLYVTGKNWPTIYVLKLQN